MYLVQYAAEIGPSEVAKFPTYAPLPNAEDTPSPISRPPPEPSPSPAMGTSQMQALQATLLDASRRLDTLEAGDARTKKVPERQASKKERPTEFAPVVREREEEEEE